LPAGCITGKLSLPAADLTFHSEKGGVGGKVLRTHRDDGAGVVSGTLTYYTGAFFLGK